MEEAWKDINGYEGLYQISSFGRIRSFVRVKGKIITPTLSADGYLRICLHKNSKRHRYYIHRLVAQAFIPNTNNLPEINHKDENKTNNFVYVKQDGSVDSEKSNLEWCTHKYNLKYGTLQERSVKSRLENSDIILAYNIMGELKGRYNNIKQIEEELGIDHSVISSCCNGRYNSSHGFIWIYESDLDTLQERINRCVNNKKTVINMSLKNHKRRKPVS